jgi:hypothetical protein
VFVVCDRVPCRIMLSIFVVGEEACFRWFDLASDSLTLRQRGKNLFQVDAAFIKLSDTATVHRSFVSISVHLVQFFLLQVRLHAESRG